MLRLWQEIEDGSPTLVEEYDPAVVRLIGSSRMLQAFDPPPSQYQATPHVTAVRLTDVGTEVSVGFHVPGDDRTSVVYLLAKTGGRWRVRYDTRLRLQVESVYAQLTEARFKDPTSPKAQDTGYRAGVRAGRALLTLFAPMPRAGTLK